MTSWEDVKIYINRYGFLGWVAFSLVIAYFLQILLYLFLSGERFDTLMNLFVLPAGSALIWKRPWTIFTYFLIHPPQEIIRFIFNILIIMSFAQLIAVVLSAEKVRKLMILAIPTLAIITCVIASFLPRLGHGDCVATISPPMMVLIFAAVTLMPDYQIMFWGLFPVKLLWIGVIVLLVNVVNIKMGNVGAIANLVGVGMGWAYIFAMKQKGVDIVEVAWKWLENLKEKLPKKSSARTDNTPFIKVQYKSNPNEKAAKSISQDEIDRILDKITEQGYSSLSQVEREILKNASKGKE